MDIKVCLLINALAAGGAEKQLLLTATGLQKLGYHCSIYWLEDRPVHPQCLGQIENAKAAGVRFLAPTRRSGIDFKQLTRLRSELSGRRNALLWTWGYRSDMVSLGILLTTWNTKIIGSLRSADKQKIRKFGWFWKVLSRTHCAFISNSWLNVQLIADIAPIVEKKSKVIYNAIEESYFQITRAVTNRPQNLRVMMVGNQTAHIKGYDVAIHLAELIKARNLSIKICIGGMPLDRVDLVATTKRQKLEDSIEFFGNISDVPRFLETGDVFMLLSRYEGTPNALLEAMALGLPAISTRVGDVAAFAEDGVHLRLIDGQGDAALATIVALWDDWPKTMAMAKAGRELCRTKFNEAAMIDASAKVIDEVIGVGAFCPTEKGPTPL